MRKDNVMLLYDYFCVKKFPFNQKGIICETNDRQPPTPPHHMSTLSYASEFCRALPNQFKIYINSKCSQGYYFS